MFGRTPLSAISAYIRAGKLVNAARLFVFPAVRNGRVGWYVKQDGYSVESYQYVRG